MPAQLEPYTLTANGAENARILGEFPTMPALVAYALTLSESRLECVTWYDTDGYGPYPLPGRQALQDYLAEQIAKR